ncbi:dipeptidase [Oryzifoliimicrobium ureilyticus]|uniref:dipeptidase n=1 Tax=Oryzifoliimicrobium ureilyticus TaxID=3113724 RepID=UPI0030766ABF
MQLVFDGHNDVLLRLWQHEKEAQDPVAEFRDGTTKGHLDAPRAKTGGVAGGLCAIYIPSGDLVFADPDAHGHYDTPMAAPLQQLPSLKVASEMASIAVRLDRAGAWRLCTSVNDIRRSIEDGVFAAVLHLEGCEPIARDLAALDLFYSAGLRSLGPVWSRHNVFGHGVPFAYPRSPDTGPGLTEAGFELVRQCNRLGIVIDLAHITEKGFWDVARVSDQPLVASHSNVHALTPVARNLTDRQLDAIKERNGLVGLNYATAMLRDDARSDGNTPLSDMVRHIDYLVDRIGIDCVALGSDFDGATIPDEIGDAAGNQKLIEALRKAGYRDEDLKKMGLENWLRILAAAWKEAP